MPFNIAVCTRWIIISLSITACGCVNSAAKEDPENDVLPAGARAVVANEGLVKLDDQRVSRGILQDMLDSKYLDPGAVVRVGHDPGYFQETAEDVESNARFAKDPAEAAAIRKAGPKRYEQGQLGASRRGVKVVVETGKHAGAAGVVNRHYLRPIK